jgi:hypothetical protein
LPFIQIAFNFCTFCAKIFTIAIQGQSVLQ